MSFKILFNVNTSANELLLFECSHKNSEVEICIPEVMVLEGGLQGHGETVGIEDLALALEERPGRWLPPSAL